MAPRTRQIARLAAIGALVAAVGLFCAGNASSIVTAVRGLRHASPAPLALGLCLSLAAMANRGGLNRASHNAVGLNAGPMTMIQPAATGFAANHLVRSGGASGAAVFVRHGAAKSFPAGAVVAACILAACCSTASLGIALTATIAIVAATDSLSAWWIAAATGFALYAAATTAALLVVVRRRDFAKRGWATITSMIRRVTRRPPVGATTTAVDDLADALTLARANPAWVRRTIAHAIGSKLLGASMLMCAAAAVGAPISATTAVVVYVTALASSLVSVVPSGIGVVEASTTALLVSAGTGLGAAALAVGVFRLLDLWMPLAIGALIARRGNARANAPVIQPAALPGASAERNLVAA